MPANVKIRKVSTKELHLIRGLDQLCFGDDGSEAIESEISDPASHWWVGFDANSPICFAGLYKYEDRCCQLLRAGVLPSHQGQGLQKSLINVRVAFARRARSSQVFTYVANWNAASMNSLISEGFKTYLPEHQFAGQDVVYFWKDLTRG